MAVPCFSLVRRFASIARAFRAVWCATPYSQFAIVSRCLIDTAFRTRTRKVAWKASSAS
jgi:hypothetical protein